MKKILSLALALMMIMSMLVVFPVSAVEDETTGYEIPRVAAGTITVDGDMDEAYENGLVFELKYAKDGTANEDGHPISAKVYMVYDANNIYLYTDVNDADELMTGPLTDEKDNVTDSSWSSDCVELTLGYLVEANTSVKITPWGKAYNGKEGWNEFPDAVGAAKAKEDNTGWTGEMSFPVDAETIKNGTTINNLFAQQYDSWALAYSEVSDGREPVAVTFGALEMPKVAADLIKVDGDMDAFYNKGLVLDISNDVAGNKEFVDLEDAPSGTAYLVYDSNNIYLYADITDTTAFVKGTSAWDTDNVEVWFGFATDPNYTDKDGAHTNPATGYRVDREGTVSNTYETELPEGVIGAAKEKEDESGYTLELQIPVDAETIENGTTIDSLFVQDYRGATKDENEEDTGIVNPYIYGETGAVVFGTEEIACEHEETYEVIVTYPTFTEDGKKEVICNICGEKTEEKIDKIENKFDDLKSDEWYAKPIAFALYTEIMHGMSDTSFAPNGNTTRAQLVQVLYNLEGGPDVDELTTPFTDLKDDWYQKAVKWAYNNEIVYGTTGTTFGPGESLTREQFAAFLYRYAQFKGYDVSGQADMSKFTDFDKAEAYAEPALKWANDAGLITGHANTTLIDPKGPATRAQMASILYRVATTEFEMAEPDEGSDEGAE